ncbi:grasp-with-spasm system SPASM domain peptide maturase [Taibaiella koreensis]|uniref:grasp-with-spasm system SPASM domain peptide maturase n=1 Tax=Taibaiella koreensis TaxID=1268548 RepID=UPI000E59AB57|nr:grasp-with-spasm system SPASM domain peptide maturase [Taibaiella koreensis]
MSDKIVFRLFSSCLLTAGSTRALICDPQRGNYYTIPLSLYSIIAEQKKASIEETLAICEDQEEAEILKSYFNFLLEHELIFLCREDLADNFTPIKYEFDVPAIIANAIVQIGKKAEYLVDTLAQLKLLGCQAFELVVMTDCPLSFLSHILELCKGQELDEVNLYIPFNPETDYEALIEEYCFLSSVTICNAPTNEEIFLNGDSCTLRFSTKDLRDHRHCGIIAEKYFIPDLVHHSESLQHNTCLNRKIAIDVNGNIKNCPSLNESFGNIKDITLEEAICQPHFKKYWNINKDQIEVCKDCEFRHVCTDCRAYLEDPSNVYSKPLKCGYDPYTCTWEDWSKNPLKENIIIQYGIHSIE